MINHPDYAPYNNVKKIDPFGDNLYKYNTDIILKESLKNTKQYLENDVSLFLSVCLCLS
jgi:hypothetical protein